MSRRVAFRSSFSALALAAVLLMALAPTVSRWLAHGSLAGLVELCTSTGLKYVDAGAFGTDADKAPVQDHSGLDADCGYCPLGAAVALLALAVALLSPPLPRLPSPVLRAGPRCLSSVFPGCGSRGPPLAL